jgi:hypothetical protein
MNDYERGWRDGIKAAMELIAEYYVDNFHEPFNPEGTDFPLIINRKLRYFLEDNTPQDPKLLTQPKKRV